MLIIVCFIYVLWLGHARLTLFFIIGSLYKRKLDVLSPSKWDILLERSLAIVSFEERPLSFHEGYVLNPLSEYRELKNTGGSQYIATAKDTLVEANYYSLLTKFVPQHLSSITPHRDPNIRDTRTLNHLFPNAIEHSLVKLPPDCQPEIFVPVASGARQAPFTAELKSMGSGVTFYSEVFTYSLAALVESFFPTDKQNKIMRVYKAPPVAFCLGGSAYMAHISIIEWVGQLRLSPWSNPFFLGSQQHNQAIAHIDHIVSSQCSGRYEIFEDINIRASLWHNHDSAAVSWTTNNGIFWKVIHGARDCNGKYYRNLYRVYAKLQEVFSSNFVPAQLVPATLWFGQFAVAVRMTAVGDSDATLDQLEGNPAIHQAVATAIVFLARHGLLYTDLRPYNVRIQGDKVWLVDYDDVIIVDNIDTFDHFEHVLRTCSVPVAYLDVDPIMEAIRTAYEVVAGGQEGKA